MQNLLGGDLTGGVRSPVAGLPGWYGPSTKELPRWYGQVGGGRRVFSSMEDLSYVLRHNDLFGMRFYYFNKSGALRLLVVC